MFKNRITLAVVAGSAVLIPVAGVTALTAAPAGALPHGITCTKTTGKVTSAGVAKINLKSCTGNTGGSGKTSGTASSTSATVTWVNTKKTTFSETTTSGTKCTQPTLVADEVVNGNVTADNTKSTAVGAAVSGEFCVFTSSTGALKIAGAPGVNFKIAA